MFSAPISSSSRKMAASRSGVTSCPTRARESSKFWQKTHRRAHPLKNTVPEPFLQEMHGSS